MFARQTFMEGENAAKTPTRDEVEGWLPMPLDVAGIVHDYLGNPFVTLWEVSKGGNHMIRLPLNSYLADCVVSWGDGWNNHIRDFNGTNATHQYSRAGLYKVHISGSIRAFRFGGCSRYTGVPIQDCSELLDVSQWGCVRLRTGCKSFEGCTKLTVTARDAPGLTDAKDLSRMFAGCVSLRKEDFSSWDTSGVTNMHGMFDGCDQFDGNVSSWSTSSVTDTGKMFRGCRLFNGDLGPWDTSKVIYAEDMFRGCVSFKGDLSSWDIGSRRVNRLQTGKRWRK